MVVKILTRIVIVFFEDGAPHGRRWCFHIRWVLDLIVIVEEEYAVVKLTEITNYRGLRHRLPLLR